MAEVQGRRRCGGSGLVPVAAGLILIWTLGIATSAEGKERSWNQVGLALHTGLARGRDAGSAHPAGPLVGAALQLRVLRIFGGELAFSQYGGSGFAGDLLAPPVYRLSGHLVIVPKEDFDVLLRLGVGAGSFGDLFDLQGSTTSYHFGPGIELMLTDHLHLSVSWILHLAGASTVQQRIEDDDRVPPLRELVNLDRWELGTGLGARF